MQSALDRLLARLATQRACLAHAAALIVDVPGPVLELGLGKGRTYTHLRSLFLDREVIAFDHGLHAPADAAPPADHLRLGDLGETLPAYALEVAARGDARPALIHADIGTADGRGELGRSDAALAREIGRIAAGLLAPGGVLLGDRDMAGDGPASGEPGGVVFPGGLVPLELPAVDLPTGVAPWPYHGWRRV